MSLLNFDATQVAPDLPRTPIPAGTYLAHIIDSDVVPTKTGGEMLKLTHEVLDGPHARRLVWSNINIKNMSQEAERIGQAQLSALCHAVGVLQPRDSNQLHMVPMRMHVTVRPAGPDRNGVHREAQNEVKSYEAVTKAAPQAQPAGSYPAAQPTQPLHTGPGVAAAQPAQPPAQPASNGRVWARRA